VRTASAVGSFSTLVVVRHQSVFVVAIVAFLLFTLASTATRADLMVDGAVARARS